MDRRLFLSLLLSFSLSGAASMGWALTLERFDPALAFPGDVVRIDAEGIDPLEAYQVTIGEQAAEILSIQADSLNVKIPSGATTSEIEVLQLPDGPSVRSFGPYRILAPATVGFADGVPIDPADYRAATVFGLESLASGETSLHVLSGSVTPVVATGETGAPIFFAVATDPQERVELSARATASALVFTSSLFFTSDPEIAEKRLAYIDGSSALDEAEAIISGHIGAGTDFGTDPLLPQALAEVTADLADILLAEEPDASAFGGSVSTPSDEPSVDFGQIFDFERESPHKLEPEPVYRIHGTLEIERDELSVADDGTPIRFVRITPRQQNGIVRANPLHWIANLYKLDPAQFRFGKLEVNTQSDDFETVYQRVSREPIARVLVPPSNTMTKMITAGTVKGLLDLIPKAVDQILFPSPPSGPPKLPVPLDKPAIYLVRAYSGSLYPPQDELIRALPDGLAESSRVLGLNLLMIALDGGSLFLTGVDSASGLSTASSTEAAILKNVSEKLAQKKATESLRADDLLLILNESLRAAIKNQVSGSVGDLLGDAAGLALTVQGAMLTGAGMDEELRALLGGDDLRERETLFGRHTVESALIMVGDPFAPRIDRFDPIRAHRGRHVTIYGSGFSPIPEDNLVAFHRGPTTSPDDPLAEPANVISADRNQLVVEVPESAETGTSPIVVQVKVEESDQILGTGDTNRLPAPYKEFEILPDPVIAGIDPPNPEAGETVRILGENFGSEVRDLMVTFETSSTAQAHPRLAAPDQLLANVPANPGSATVQVSLRYLVGNEMRERSSNVFSFEIAEPESPLPGSHIRVTSAADNNVRDGEITLREALMLANGTLDISELTEPPDPRPEDTRYETDHVDGNVAGAAVRNIIERGFTGDPVITLHSPLPPVSSWTMLDLGATFLYSGSDPIISGGDTVDVGLSFDGTREATVRDLHLTGFGTAAIHMTSQARENNLTSMSIDGGSGGGVQIDSGRFNSITVAVRNVSGDGFHLAGSQVVGNEIFIPADGIRSNGGWGIHIRDGASLNSVVAWAPSGSSDFPGSGPIQDNGLGGVRFTGESSFGNFIGVPPGFAGGIALPAPPVLIDNGNGEDGPGLLIEAPASLVWRVYIGGNDGDGIRISGPSSGGTQIAGGRIGISPDGGEPHPNGGNGITIREGAESVLIGGRFRHEINGGPPPANYIGRNREHGILLDGVSDVEINTTRIGGFSTAELERTSIPNEKSGVVLRNSGSCKIGSEYLLRETVFLGDFPVTYVSRPLRLEVTDHLEGAGIRLEGSETTGNLITGTYIGCEAADQSVNPESTDFGNGIGIEIVDGAYGNHIGLREDRYNSNFIRYNRRAGLRMNSGGDPTISIPPEGSPFRPTGGNVIVNNAIRSQHEVGILLEQGARFNRIGGTSLDELNNIAFSGTHGVYFNGVTASRRELSNRLLGNVISEGGSRIDSAGDPLQDAPAGAGILLTDSHNQIIGGHRSGEGNWIWRNWSGLFIENSTEIAIVGNRVGGTRSNVHQNRLAGVVVRGGSSNEIGPGNKIFGNGLEGFSPRLGGVVLTGGQDQRVFGNFIGWDPEADEISGNHPDGILLNETSGNTIGGTAFRDGNRIVASERNGLRVQGGNTVGNQVGGNDIGFLPAPGVSPFGAPEPIGEDGILFRNDASDNPVGEMTIDLAGIRRRLPAENRIYHSGGAGIRVDGSDTLRNSLLFNSISSNTGPGIDNVNGGNAERPPPEITAFSRGDVTGTVEAGIPDGSRVQVFSDNDDEGAVYHGEGPVRGGVFDISIGAVFGRNISATVTDPAGNTSEFGSPISFTPGIELARLDPPAEQTAPAGASEVVAARLSAIALNSPTEVLSIRIAASGDLDSMAEVTGVSLYRDADSNGILSGGDILLGGPATFEGGIATIELTGAQLDTFIPQYWLLAFDFADDASLGGTFSVSILQGTDISAVTILPGGMPALAVGGFPLQSDGFTIIDGSEPLRLEIRRNGEGQLEIFWNTEGILQQTTDLHLPWEDLPEATSPYVITTPGTQGFFRLKSGSPEPDE